MAGNCGGIIRGAGAGSRIDNQLEAVLGYGNTSYNTALEAIQSINDLFRGVIRSGGVGTGAGRPADSVLDLPEFVKPEVPEDPELEFVPPDSVSDPPGFAAPNVSFGTAPTFNSAPPSVNLPTQPGALDATAPEDPAAIQYPEYPDDLTITLPLVPELRDLNLPTLVEPDLTTLLADLQALRSEKPEAPEVFLNDNFLADIDNQYQVTKGRLASYIGECPAFELVCSNLSEMMAGGHTGLPAAVEQALRDRAFQAQDKQSYQEEQQVYMEWLSRGFSVPDGVLNSRLDAVRQKNADRKREINRDIFIKMAELEIENLRFAIQQGIAYEGMHRDSWFKLYDLSRNIAAQTFEVQSKILDARVAVYQAALAGWRQEFETYRIWLEAELANLEIYRQKLEAQRIIQQINQQDIDIYRARLSGVQTEVEVYKAQIDAANSQLQGELAKIEVHKSQVQAYTARVGAYEAEWRGYGEAVKGELGKTEVYKALVSAFGERVNAYRTETDAKRIEGEFDLGTQRLRLEAWRGKLEQFQSQLQGEVARIDAGAKVFDSKTRLYGAEVDAEKSSIDVEAEEARMQLQRYIHDATLALKEAELGINENLSMLQATVSALDGIARTGSQLASGALSALSMSASISDSTSYSNSVGCSTSYSIDATP